ncbi:hypothetical protein GCM10010988_41160 [Cnuibacter physcomitrellae]|nr:hypothetical protein GCM10010988_41160 [Cnuibacter physcomitrellae]
MKVTAVIRTIATQEVTGEGTDYDAARAAVDAQAPEGFQVLSYSVERCVARERRRDGLGR